MKRTTVMLPPELKEKASRLAREKGISLGELLRGISDRCSRS